MQRDVFFLDSTQDKQYSIIMKHIDDKNQSPHPSLPNHQYPFALKSVREIVDKYGRKPMISMDGFNAKPDQKANKKSKVAC
jgi:Ni,Fe-hydrogenase III component G